MNALVYVNIEQGIHKGQNNVAWSERGKKLCGYSYTWNISLSTNLLFLKSGHDDKIGLV